MRSEATDIYELADRAYIRARAERHAGSSVWPDILDACFARIRRKRTKAIKYLPEYSKETP
jgi:hypothetical protein